MTYREYKYCVKKSASILQNVHRNIGGRPKKNKILEKRCLEYVLERSTISGKYKKRSM
jgi:hypothetical protein